MRNELIKYTEDELIEELVRRKNQRERARPVKYCDECRHFIPTHDEKVNPCSMDHKMIFRSPEDYNFEDYGFYRRVCADRNMKADNT